LSKTPTQRRKDNSMKKLHKNFTSKKETVESMRACTCTCYCSSDCKSVYDYTGVVSGDMAANTARHVSEL